MLVTDEGPEVLGGLLGFPLVVIRQSLEEVEGRGGNLVMMSLKLFQASLEILRAVAGATFLAAASDSPAGEGLDLPVSQPQFLLEVSDLAVKLPCPVLGDQDKCLVSKGPLDRGEFAGFLIKFLGEYPITTKQQVGVSTIACGAPWADEGITYSYSFLYCSLRTLMAISNLRWMSVRSLRPQMMSFSRRRKFFWSSASCSALTMTSIDLISLVEV